MSKPAHIVFITLLVLIVISSFTLILVSGCDYYGQVIPERPFHAAHDLLKPSGAWGHGFGIAGSLSMILGVSLYMARKRYKFARRWGILKHWLEFHIFLCTLGPILVMFHTAFKFGGIVAISFWSMVAVFLSGIVGRFIYIQIPRTIEGRELSLQEVREMKGDPGRWTSELDKVGSQGMEMIRQALDSGTEGRQNGLAGLFTAAMADSSRRRSIRKELEKQSVPGNQVKAIMKVLKSEMSLNRRIGRLKLMQDLFKYWHVAHLPFALVMLVIMVIHVAVTIVFGYRWIF